MLAARCQRLLNGPHLPLDRGAVTQNDTERRWQGVRGREKGGGKKVLSNIYSGVILLSGAWRWHPGFLAGPGDGDSWWQLLSGAPRRQPRKLSEGTGEGKGAGRQTRRPEGIRKGEQAIRGTMRQKKGGGGGWR